jgi:lysophospholipid acyltransferase (LPLAT)-like uncharacterized protein
MDRLIYAPSVMIRISRVFIVLFDGVLARCRIRIEGRDRVFRILNTRPYLLVSWHGRLILYFSGPRSEKPCTMASRSRSGYMASLLQEAGGYEVFRGSSRRGGMQALMQMQRYMKKWDRSAMLSVDGSTGPIYVMKPGAVYLAAALSYPIIPVSFSAKRAVTFNSWDRLMLPLPYTECTLIYGRPFFVSKDASDETITDVTRQIQDELRRITAVADRRYGHPPMVDMG